ncbi:hypothetical protein NA57DRAFT_56316 [Rhizodiscina lignyota]|uniref:Uncharacterized protein n=1 Tax=Rhizodiscina lignyota TaxID=1504668 RepID=A0A9P4M693_9PEZI|nr:hypothetical protein NA57DRAFT_56316 [Rhizodiscina lignyota]
MVNIFKAKPVEDMTNEELLAGMRHQWWMSLAVFFFGDKWREERFTRYFNEQTRRQMGIQDVWMKPCDERQESTELEVKSEEELTEEKRKHDAFRVQLQWYKDHPMRFVGAGAGRGSVGIISPRPVETFDCDRFDWVEATYTPLWTCAACLWLGLRIDSALLVLRQMRIRTAAGSRCTDGRRDAFGLESWWETSDNIIHDRTRTKQQGNRRETTLDSVMIAGLDGAATNETVRIYSWLRQITWQSILLFPPHTSREQTTARSQQRPDLSSLPLSLSSLKSRRHFGQALMQLAADEAPSPFLPTTLENQRRHARRDSFCLLFLFIIENLDNCPTRRDFLSRPHPDSR